jgi:hypothetical protein
MADARCSCGFTEAGEETITDHLLQVFVPEDCLAGDGLVHEEVRPDLKCSCGLAAATPGELDAHFLRVFTTGDLIGRDGRTHVDGSVPSACLPYGRALGERAAVAGHGEQAALH